MKQRFIHIVHAAALSIVALISLVACGGNSSLVDGKVVVNLAYFPNLTHAVALVGMERGVFQKELGAKVLLQTQTFNAGPGEIQALLAGSIDIGFVGPSPALNGYIQSHRSALQVIAGASSAGVLFVVRANETIQGPADLAHKKIADPQRGGTQDVALRTYLQQHGLKSTDQGGDVQIISTDNASIFSLFKQGQIDGAWMPEPWATRLLMEGKGKVFLDESSLWPGGHFATTVVVVRQAFYKEHPEIVKNFLRADVETVQYIRANGIDAQRIANREIQRITGSAMKSSELPLAFRDLQITYDPLARTINEQARRVFALGFVKSRPDLAAFYNLGPLNAVLTSQGLTAVATA